MFFSMYIYVSPIIFYSSISHRNYTVISFVRVTSRAAIYQERGRALTLGDLQQNVEF